MNMRNFSYELGVMMFNASADTPTGSYDLTGNFQAMVNCVSDFVDKDTLKDGFVSEASNHKVDDSKANIMFDEAYARYF